MPLSRTEIKTIREVAELARSGKNIRWMESVVAVDGIHRTMGFYWECDGKSRHLFSVPAHEKAFRRLVAEVKAEFEAALVDPSPPEAA